MMLRSLWNIIRNAPAKNIIEIARAMGVANVDSMSQDEYRKSFPCGLAICQQA